MGSLEVGVVLENGSGLEKRGQDLYFLTGHSLDADVLGRGCGTGGGISVAEGTVWKQLAVQTAAREINT